MHKVAWDKVCRTKDHGGLGIQRMHDLSKSLLVKQSWRLVNKENSLSMEILGSKYTKGCQGLKALHATSSSSPTWKGITKQKDVLELGLGMNIKNG